MLLVFREDGGGGGMLNTLLYLGECLLKVVNDIVDMLHTYRETHCRRGDMLLGKLRGCHL